MHSYLSGLGAALCAALLVGCGDSPVVPTPQGQGSSQPLNASITLTPDSSLRWVPEIITIRVQISGPDADSLRKLPVWWTSTDPSLVALAEPTDTSVVAIPQHDGVARVIATVGDVADTARLVCREEGAVLAKTFVVRINYFGTPAFSSDGSIVVFGGEDYLRSVLALDRGFAPLWTFAVGVEYRNAAIGEDGNVFVGGSGMTALSSTGAVRWEDATVFNLDAAPALDGRGDVWFGGYQGPDFDLTLGHYDASGLVATTPLPPGTNPIHLPPVIVGDSVVIVGGDHYLVGISLSDSILWVDTLPGSQSRVGYAPLSAAGDGRTTYVPAKEGPVFAIDGLTGAVTWSWRDADPEPMRYPSAPIVDTDGSVYVQTSATLVALTPDGAVRWRADSLYGNQVFYAAGAPALAGGGILYVACQSDLCAVNTADGSVRWRRRLSVDGIAGAALFILPDSSIVFQTVNQQGASYLVKLRGRYPLADAPWPVDGGDLRRTRRGHMP
jgi:outer membrane protein assembly factor BamB